LIVACRSRAENRNRNPVPRVSWTVDEFCVSVGISRSTYEKAKRDGWGPREMVLGSTGIRITDEARAEWIASREEKAATVASKRRGRHSGHAVEEKTAT
jgi:hypothetical protein